jgi:hypothetical protein
MVHDQPDVIQGPATLDQIAVRFDEQRLVSDAGLLLTAYAAQGSTDTRLGAGRTVQFGGERKRGESRSGVASVRLGG